jgi:hypothetical protein
MHQHAPTILVCKQGYQVVDPWPHLKSADLIDAPETQGTSPINHIKKSGLIP